MSADARLLSATSPDDVLLAAASAAQAVESKLAQPLMDVARANALERRQARKLKDVFVDASTESEF